MINVTTYDVSTSNIGYYFIFGTMINGTTCDHFFGLANFVWSAEVFLLNLQKLSCWWSNIWKYLFCRLKNVAVSTIRLDGRQPCCHQEALIYTIVLIRPIYLAFCDMEGRSDKKVDTVYLHFVIWKVERSNEKVDIVTVWILLIVICTFLNISF